MSELKLHGYQEAAVAYLRGRRRAALFLDMGLGKTAATLRALEPQHLPVLVVAPKRVSETVWPVEVPKWRPDLTVAVATGSPARRAAVLRGSADIIVVTRDTLADAVPVADRFRTFVLDELSSFKTKSSGRWKAASKVIQGMERAHPDGVQVWGLTGTPSPNGLMDLWAQVYLLDRGERLGSTLTGFRGRYFMPGRRLPSGIITEWIIREEAEEAILGKLEDICLSMTTEDRLPDLPPMSYNRVTVALPPKARQAYKEMKRDYLVDLTDLGLAGEVRTASGAAVLTSKLAQMSAGFLYPDEHLGSGPRPWVPLHQEKVRALLEIIDGTGSPVLVFYRFQAEADMVKAALPAAVHTIKEPNIVDRWNAGEVPVLLAHPASAGHGLNLQFGGHTIAWTSLPWSLEEWQQGNKRLARQGQTHPVVVHTLEAERTVDPGIWDALHGKKTIQDALMDHLESPL